MSSKPLFIAAAALVASAIALPAVAQIPVPPPPPLPSLEMRIVAAEPPPPPGEIVVRGERPGPDYVWVGGFYDWQGDDWVWVPGHWIAPPEPTVRWVSARYVRVDGGFRYEPPHWSNQKLVVVKEKVKFRKEKVKAKGRHKD